MNMSFNSFFFMISNALRTDFKKYLLANYNKNRKFFKIRGMANDYLTSLGEDIRKDYEVKKIRKQLCHSTIQIIKDLKSRGLIKNYSTSTYEVIDFEE